MDKPFRRRDLLGIRNLSAEEILGILNTAENFREINQRELKKSDLARKDIINLFSGKLDPASAHLSSSPPNALSADAVNISVSSSACQGENAG